MTVKLGNLLPGETATLKSTLLCQLEIVGGHYSYSLPSAFFPDYKKLGLEGHVYDFAYEISIISESPITNLSMPANAIISEQNDSKTNLKIRSTQPGRKMDVYYRTADMLVPQLQYARGSDGDEFAVFASLTPTFDRE